MTTPKKPSIDRQHGKLMRAASIASVVVALTLIALKVWAWNITGSIALLSSLADSMLDLAASLITFVAIRIALTPADHEHRFGHGKSEAIAAVIQALIISLSAGYVAFRAIARILQPEPIESPEAGYLAMGISLGLTICLVIFQRIVVRKTNSLAVGADAAHYQIDLLTNAATIFALVLSSQFGWIYADPILGLLIVVLILASVRNILVTALDELLDREFPEEDRDEIEAIAVAHSAVRGVHEIRTRSAGLQQFIQFHLVFDRDMTLETAHLISDEISASIKRRFPRAEVLIHADPEDDSTSNIH